jgi:hypothetical protein
LREHNQSAILQVNISHKEVVTVYKRDGNPRIWLSCLLALLGVASCLFTVILSFHVTFMSANQTLVCWDKTYELVEYEVDGHKDGHIEENGLRIILESSFEGARYGLRELVGCGPFEGYLVLAVLRVGQVETDIVNAVRMADGSYELRRAGQ